MRELTPIPDPIPLLCLYLLPTFIAFYRQHDYRWIILATNVILGGTGLGWLIVFVGAIFPRNKSLADPFLGNPTGTGDRNAEHTLGEVRATADEVRSEKLGMTSALDRLASLAEKGVITPEEFEKKRKRA